MKRMQDLARIDRPREKLERYGAQKLSDQELFAVMLGSGVRGAPVSTLAERIVQVLKKTGHAKVSRADVLAIKGLGSAKASQILAVIELAKRLGARAPEVLTAKDVWTLCLDVRDSKKEHLVAFYLDTQNRLLERQIVSVGTLTASLVHPREVFEPAVALRAGSVIVAHNHPSGSITPSPEDTEVTHRLKEAGVILGIPLLDHVIVTKTEHYSFRDAHTVW
jgi:DNA repair protein RadC